MTPDRNTRLGIGFIIVLALAITVTAVLFFTTMSQKPEVTSQRRLTPQEQDQAFFSMAAGMGVHPVHAQREINVFKDDCAMLASGQIHVAAIIFTVERHLPTLPNANAESYVHGALAIYCPEQNR